MSYPLKRANYTFDVQMTGEAVKKCAVHIGNIDFMSLPINGARKMFVLEMDLNDPTEPTDDPYFDYDPSQIDDNKLYTVSYFRYAGDECYAVIHDAPPIVFRRR